MSAAGPFGDPQEWEDACEADARSEPVMTDPKPVVTEAAREAAREWFREHAVLEMGSYRLIPKSTIGITEDLAILFDQARAEGEAKGRAETADGVALGLAEQAGYNRGGADERAAVVAFLGEPVRAIDTIIYARRIEAGHHLPPKEQSE